MMIRLPAGPESRLILSAAFDPPVMEDLTGSGTSFFTVRDGRLVLYPMMESFELSDKDQQILLQASNYDVFEFFENGLLVRRIDVCSGDNILFITGHCNSNCIMCPSPEYSRRHDEWPDIDRQLELASHMPTYLPHVTITGGEPFLAGGRLFDLLNFLKSKFDQTEFLLLTNGRIFCLDRYADLFEETAPAGILVGIPVHGSSAEIHDAITQTPGSFDQTMAGIDNLLRRNIRVEIRIVVSALNHDLGALGQMIAGRFPAISHVSIIAMEMTGSARANKDKVWISYQSSAEAVRKLTDHLIAHQIDVRLYNFPLCTVHPSHWMLARKSISEHKVRYGQNCGRCKIRHQCGGLFAGTLALEEEELDVIE